MNAIGLVPEDSAHDTPEAIGKKSTDFALGLDYLPELPSVMARVEARLGSIEKTLVAVGGAIERVVGVLERITGLGAKPEEPEQRESDFGGMFR